MSASGTPRRRDERGSITVLTLGFVGVLLGAVVVVVDVSAVILARRGASAAADGAAAAAAQQVDRSAIGTVGLDAGVPLDPVAVDDSVATYQRVAGQDQPGLLLVATVDGALATVTAQRPVRLPFVGWLGIDPAVDVTAETTVRSPAVLP